MRRVLIALLCLAAVAVAAGAEPADERVRLAEERQAITQRFAQEEVTCRQRFAATGCLGTAQARRRDALAPLRERELKLADDDRQRRAAERRRVVAAKVQAAAARPAAAPEPVLKLRQVLPAARPSSASASASVLVAPRTSDDTARETDAAQRARASAQRQSQIDAARQRVADRVAARASEGGAAQPLPPLPTRAASQPGR